MKTLLGVLGCRFFLFITLNILSHSLSSDLHCCCWNNLKSVDNLMGIPCMLFVALLFFAVLGAESSLLRVGFLCLRQVRCSPAARTGVSRCGARFRLRASVLVAHSSSCSAARGIFPDQGWEPVSPALAGGFPITGPPRKPRQPVFWWLGGAVFLQSWLLGLRLSRSGACRLLAGPWSWCRNGGLQESSHQSCSLEAPLSLCLSWTSAGELQPPFASPGDPLRSLGGPRPGSCKGAALSWAPVHMKPAVCPQRGGLHSPALWSSCTQALLAFKAKWSGGSSF